MAAAAGNRSVWVTRTVNRPVVASGQPDSVRATVADMGPSLPLAEAALRGRPRLVIRPTMQTGLATGEPAAAICTMLRR